MYQKSLRKDKGFTLLEIIIALAIIALVFTGLFSVFSSALGVADDVKRAQDLDQVARVILLQINKDLRSYYDAYTDKQKDDSNNQAEDLAQQDLEDQKEQRSGFRAREFIPERENEQVLLEFYSASSLGFSSNYPQLRANHISYILRKKEKPVEYTEVTENRDYILLRKEVPFAGEELEQKEKIFEMASNVVSCTFNYQDREGEDFSTWQASEAKNKIPALVKVKLVLRGQQGHERSYRLNVDLHQKDQTDESQKP